MILEKTSNIDLMNFKKYDGFVHQREYIAYCPYCGRKLGKQIQVSLDENI